MKRDPPVGGLSSLFFFFKQKTAVEMRIRDWSSDVCSSDLGVNSTALGNAAMSIGDNSVALGADSLADRDNSVSVGDVGNERQVTNVAAGTELTDAVNLEQLHEVEKMAEYTSRFFDATGAGEALSVGDEATASGSDAYAEGDYSTATGSASAALGVGSSAFGSGAVAVGEFSSASGYNAVADGNNSVASGSASQAIGNSSIAIGGQRQLFDDEGNPVLDADGNPVFVKDRKSTRLNSSH